jgi:hypothetical protein
LCLMGSCPGLGSCWFASPTTVRTRWPFINEDAAQCLANTRAHLLVVEWMTWMKKQWIQ